MSADGPAPKTVIEALELISSYIESSTTIANTEVSHSQGRVVAEDVFSPITFPQFDSAAMDGFAVCSEDVSPDGTAMLKVKHVIPAGQTGRIAISRGEAARITTGAMLPSGADRVVMQENTRTAGNEVHLFVPMGSKPHVRRVGGDIPVGAKVLSAGEVVTAGHVAMLTGLGIRTIKVHARAKVGLLSTGNELCDAPNLTSVGQVYDTNRPMLSIMARAMGAEVTDLGIVPDNLDTVLSVLVGAAAEHDLLISSGGASAGFADFLTEAVSQRGRVEFWKLNMRPGKPIGFGDVDDCPILILPGNPISAMAGFTLFGRPILRRISGDRSGQRKSLRLPISCDYPKPFGRTQCLPATLVVDEKTGQTTARPLPDRGSASLTALATATALIVLNDLQGDIRSGDVVDVHLLVSDPLGF